MEHCEGGRGFCPADVRDFSGDGLRRARVAAGDVTCLLDRGYPLKSAVTFCANHFQLSARQRAALMRSCASAKQIMDRRKRERGPDSLAGAHLDIDGLNTIITLETGLSGSVVLLCSDGAVRDIAGLHGTYRLRPVTDTAILLIAQKTTDTLLGSVTLWLDRPVSNSGRLAERIRNLWPAGAPTLSVSVVPDVDRQLAQAALVATSDAVILDRAKSWTALTRPILQEQNVPFTVLHGDTQ